MANSEGTSDQDIGRPGPWGEGRYQQKGQPVDKTVFTPPSTVPHPDTRISTPVTRKDYESSDAESPGGDAG